MAYDNSSDENNNQFVISYELLILLQWLIDNDGKKLKRIITKALTSGLKEELQQAENIDPSTIHEDIHYSIVEFFGLLESLLLDTIDEQAVQTAIEKNLMPAIDHIDSTVCDDATVRFSIEKATSKINSNPQENPQEVLFKELLKRWKPSKKKIQH